MPTNPLKTPTERVNTQGLVLLVASCVCMAPVWLVSRDLWDGVIAAYAIETQQFEGLRLWLTSSNWWLLYAAYRSVAWLASNTGIEWWVFVKLVMHASVLGVAWETTKLGQHTLGLSPRFALFGGAMLCALPVWPMMYDSVHMVYVFVWLALSGHRLWSTSSNPAWRILGLVFIAVSLQLNSNVLFVLALEASRWLVRDRAARSVNLRQSLVVLAVVIAYAVLSRVVFPPSGPNLGYNAPLMPWHLDGLKRILAATAMFGTWMIFPVGGLLIGAAHARVLRRPLAGVQLRSIACLLLISFGAIGAYAAVGKGPALFFPFGWSSSYVFSQLAMPSSIDGWTSTADHWIGRHAFLWVIPVALMCATVLSALCELPRRVLMVVAAGLLLHALAWQFHGHEAKMSRVLMEESIIAALAKMPPPPSGDVNLHVSPRHGILFSTAESNYMLHRAWQRDHYMGATSYVEGSTPVLTEAGRRSVKEIVQSHPPMAQGNAAGSWVQATDHLTGCTTQIDVAVAPPMKFMTVLQYIWSRSVPDAAVRGHSTSCQKIAER